MRTIFTEPEAAPCIRAVSPFEFARFTFNTHETKHVEGEHTQAKATIQSRTHATLHRVNAFLIEGLHQDWFLAVKSEEWRVTCRPLRYLFGCICEQ